MRGVIGLDGGGSKTDCVLLSQSGAALARGLGGPSNPFRIGFASALNGIRTAIAQALGSANLDGSALVAICAGLAGVAQAADAEKMRSLLSSEYPSAEIRVCTDLDLALATAPPGPVVLLIAGTGAVAISRDASGEIARIGGHGPMISDEGSAYDVGRRAVMGAVREFDRTGKNSPLGERILAEIGSASWVVVRDRVQAAPDEVFPRLFSVTAVMADRGDPAAQEILGYAARKLAETASAACERLKLGDQPFHLVQTGGMLGRSKYLDAQLHERLRSALPNARFAAPTRSAAEAAAYLALEMTASGAPGKAK